MITYIININNIEWISSTTFKNPYIYEITTVDSKNITKNQRSSFILEIQELRRRNFLFADF